MLERGAVVRNATQAANALLRLRLVEDALEPRPGTPDHEKAWATVYAIRSVREEVNQLLEEICERVDGELYGDPPAGEADAG